MIQQAVKKDREGRFNSAHTLTRALEDVTLRVEGADDLHPYPGLASFNEEDAEYFFGREAEVEQMWRKLDGPPRMLALVGPSGAGKSSFLRAGLVTAKTTAWTTVICAPGSSPMRALANAFVEEFAGDAEAMRQMLDFDVADSAVEMVSRWSDRHDHALLIVDQFEEIFTQNGPEEQRRVADLLNRFVLEADVHVLLSMRDDFFFHCHRYDAFTPLQDGMTLIGPPVGGALRRALVRPATKCGYRFEDDELVDEMLADVEGERGALPLLAFAAARLWEMRDRETGLLTRQAYQDIGGVAGALARHAEATIDRIGVERIQVVRELFRNLVTAEGTRAVREWNELLSIFSDSQTESAEEVLRELIDARLLTSYEVREDEHEPTRRVEIIHESLLANWPRLVRWQTQDADSTRLRDELRQAARTWDEHNRTRDYLWSGKAFREFSVWRENYPGGLTTLEEEFASAMTTHARRRTRLRRIAVASGFVVLLTGLAIVGSFWQRSVREARRAEAAELFAFGQLQLPSNPTATLAYTIASLELADRPSTRFLALEALWRGPPAMIVSEEPSGAVRFTGDGRWLVRAFDSDDKPLRVFDADGSNKLLAGTESHKLGNSLWFEGGGIFLTKHRTPEDGSTVVELWSASERLKMAEARYESGQNTGYEKRWTDDQTMILISEGGGRTSVDTLAFDGEHRRLGTRDLVPGYSEEISGVTTNLDAGRLVASTNGHEIYVSELSETGLSEPRLVGRQSDPVVQFEVDALDRFAASADSAGRIRIWDLSGVRPPDVLQGPRDMIDLRVSHDGRFMQANPWSEKGDREHWVWSLDGERPELVRRINLGKAAPSLIGVTDPVGRQVAHLGTKGRVRVWQFSAPPDAEPLELMRGDSVAAKQPVFHPKGTWLAIPETSGLSLWPLTWPSPLVIRRHDDGLTGLVFGPEGRWLASSSNDGTVKIWSLDGETPPPGRLLFDANGYVTQLAGSPVGDRLLAATAFSGVYVISLSEGTPRSFSESGQRRGVAFSPDGRLAAASASRQAAPDIGIWDVESGERIAVLTYEGSTILKRPLFVDRDTLLAVDQSGLRRWDIETSDSELVLEGNFVQYDATRNGRWAILLEVPPSTDLQRAVFADLETGEKTPLESHGSDVSWVALDPSGAIAVTGDTEGAVRVGPVTGEEPHVFLGHDQRILTLAIDPAGHWIASGSRDNTIRLWPMPDLSKPPLHTLPREELIAKLKTLTNLRVVRDDESPTGWTLTHDPFPGWETVPTW